MKTVLRVAAGAAALLLLVGCSVAEPTPPPVGTDDTPKTADTTAAPTTTIATAATTTEATATTTVTTTTATTTEATATVTTTTAPTTAALTAEEQVRGMLQTGRIAAIYKATYNSIFSRVGASGYFQESTTGRYKGEYIRSIGALVKLALEAGETAAAGRALKFVTDTMTLKNLTYFPFTISADKQTVRTEDEIDGRAHFVLGWALYVLQSGDAAYEDATYAMLAKETDALIAPKYLFGEGTSPRADLLFNRRFTHTRMKNANDYWESFDLLTNSFGAAMLEQMIAVAERRGDTAAAERWQTALDTIADGMAAHMTHEAAGKTVYWELYTIEKGALVPEAGYSWVCLSPAAAEWSGTDPAILANTAAAVRKALWQKTKAGGYLAVECTDKGVLKNWILGKSVGWDIDIARETGDYAHILEWFRFLEANHKASDIYMETMKPKNGGWTLGDCGNGEQCIWFIWALARLRRDLGLSVRP